MKRTNFKNLFWSGMLITLCIFVPKNIYAQQPEFTHDIYQIYERALYDNHSFNIIDGDLYFTTWEAELGIYSNGEYTQIELYEEIGYQVPVEFVKVDDRIYFRVSNGSVDSQLAMLKDGVVTKITDFPDGSYMTYLTAFDGSVFFRADGGTNGSELWQHDGTTLTEYDLLEGSEASGPQYFFVYNDELLFNADDGTNGRELWRYTTESGPEMVQDLYVGATDGVSGNPHYAVFNNELYLNARTNSPSSTGYELFTYDGTDISLADDIISGSTQSLPRYMTVHDGKLYFEAGDAGERELYEYNGTSSTQISNINSSANINLFNMASAGGYLFFNADDGTSGSELYVYDGENFTPFDIREGGASSPSRFTVYNDKLYFTATDGFTNRLWQHDGTTLTDMADFGSDTFSPRYVLTYGDKLYYTGTGGANQDGYHPWVFDGSTAELIVTSGASGGSGLEGDFAEIDGKIYFTAEDGVHGGELWVYDGQTSTMVADLYEGEDWSSPTDLTVFNNKLYFFADVFYGGVDYGNELVEVDGSNVNIIDINEGSEGSGSFLPGFITYDNDLYFRASDGTNGFELWKYDGTTATLAADIESGAGSSSPGFFAEYDGKLYFQANTAATGKELWSYDGTTATLVEDLYDGGHTTPTSLTVANGKLFFTGSTESSGTELFVYDGTTVLEYNINESGDGYPQWLTAYGDELVFAATDGSVAGTAGREFWVTDGSSTSALEQFNIDETENGSQPSDFVEFNGELYFRADDGLTGQELWKYDGENVPQVHDIFPGENNSGLSNSHSLGVIGPYLYLGATVEEGNTELYRTDGTTLELVAEITEGDDGSYPWGFFPTDDYLYFVAQDYRGDELWRIRRTFEENDILGFTIADQDGESTINSTSHTITVEMPFGTDLSNLSPTFTISEYAEVSPGSGEAQNFSNGAVTYTVTAEFGNTQEWQVNVVEGAASTETDILTFALGQQTGAAVINTTAHTVAIEVAYGTDVSSLLPTITLSEGASISPQGAQNFSEVFNYTVTAQDSETSQVWTVTVAIAPSNETDILTFVLDEQTGAATIDMENHKVDIEVANGTDLSSLQPTITVSDGATISPTGVQDFTSSVTYTVTAEDELTTQQWEVTIIEEEAEPEPLFVSGLEIKLNVYPNPTTGRVYIEGISGETRVEVFDLNGQIVSAHQLHNQGYLMLENIKSGLYQLRLTNDKISTTTRLLIRR